MKINGSILIEVILSLAMAGFAILSLTLLFTSGYDGFYHSKCYTHALYLAESKIEDIPLAINPTYLKETTSVEEIEGINYTWTRKIKPVEENKSLAYIEILVQWQEKDGKHQAQLATESILNK